MFTGTGAVHLFVDYIAKTFDMIYDIAGILYSQPLIACHFLVVEANKMGHLIYFVSSVAVIAAPAATALLEGLFHRLQRNRMERMRKEEEQDEKNGNELILVRPSENLI